MKEVDVGFTHVAFSVRDLDKSIAFYERYAGMTVVHRREPDVAEARRVAWLSDHTRPFALVLVQPDQVVDTPLGHFGHLGVACASREDIDNKIELARADNVLRKEPVDAGEPVGYYVFFADPDGNTLELSYGQRVGLEAISGNIPV